MTDNSLADSIPASIRGPMRTVLARMLENLPTTEVPALGSAIDRHRQALLARGQRTAQPGAALIEALSVACHRLLADYHTYSARQRALVVGAVRYFVAEEDANRDGEDLFGLDDDLAVVNAIAVAIGRPELVVQRPTD